MKKIILTVSIIIVAVFGILYYLNIDYSLKTKDIQDNPKEKISSETPNQTKEKKKFLDFNVSLPEGWGSYIYTESKMSFGKLSNFNNEGYDGEWFIFIYDADDIRTKEGYDYPGKQFSDLKVVTEDIYISGLPATLTIKTTEEIDNWYLVDILILKDGVYYRIANGAVKDDQFEDFYKSFRFLE